MASPNISTEQPMRLVLALEQDEEWGGVRHRFEDGKSQGFLRVDAKLTDYRLVFEGTPANLLSLRTFLDALKGPSTVFYFNNPLTSETDVPCYTDQQPTGYRWVEPGRCQVSLLVHRTV